MFHVQVSPHSHLPSLTGEILNWPLWCDQLLIANWLRCWVDTNRESSDNFSTVFCHPSHYLKSFSHHNKQQRVRMGEKNSPKKHTFCVPAKWGEEPKNLCWTRVFSCEAHRHDINVRAGELKETRSKIEKKEFASLTLVAFIRRQKKFKWISGVLRNCREVIRQRFHSLQEWRTSETGRARPTVQYRVVNNWIN